MRVSSWMIWKKITNWNKWHFI